mgnify:CR=1 FL=1
MPLEPNFRIGNQVPGTVEQTTLYVEGLKCRAGTHLDLSVQGLRGPTTQVGSAIFLAPLRALEQRASRH